MNTGMRWGSRDRPKWRPVLYTYYTHIYITYMYKYHTLCMFKFFTSFVEDRGVSRYHNFWYLEANVWIAKNRLKTHFDGLSKDQVGHCNKSPLLWKAFSCIRAIHKTLLFIFSLSILSFLNAWLTHSCCFSPLIDKPAVRGVEDNNSSVQKVAFSVSLYLHPNPSPLSLCLFLPFYHPAMPLVQVCVPCVHLFVYVSICIPCVFLVSLFHRPPHHFVDKLSTLFVYVLERSSFNCFFSFSLSIPIRLI